MKTENNYEKLRKVEVGFVHLFDKKEPPREIPGRFVGER
jgi:hypothetical protein